MCTHGVPVDHELDALIPRLRAAFATGDVAGAGAALEDAAAFLRRARVGLDPRARALARALEQVVVLMERGDASAAEQLVVGELSRAIGVS